MTKKQQRQSGTAGKKISPDILMVDLLSAVYWFDEALQAGLTAKGWSQVTRVQSLVLANIASGVHRATQLARNLGVSRQAISQTLAEMETRGLISMTLDPEDRRALIVDFSESSTAIRDDARHILKTIEATLAKRIGKSELKALKDATSADWGPSPVDEVAAKAVSAPKTARKR